MVIRETAYSDDGVCGGESYVSMGGLVTWWCANGNSYSVGDARNVDVGVDVGVDVALDIALDVGVDVALDVGVDVALDLSLDL